MDEEKFYNQLENYSKGTELNLTIDRGNGELEIRVIFNGFDTVMADGYSVRNSSPNLSLKKSGKVLDIDKIGGYDSIISVKEENIFKRP